MDLATAKKIVSGLDREDNGQGALSSRTCCTKEERPDCEDAEPENRRWNISPEATPLVNSTQDILEALIKVCVDYETRVRALERFILL